MKPLIRLLMLLVMAASTALVPLTVLLAWLYLVVVGPISFVLDLGLFTHERFVRLPFCPISAAAPLVGRLREWEERL